MIKKLKISLCFWGFTAFTSTHIQAKNYIETNGLLVVEAEDFASQHLDDKRRWLKFDMQTSRHPFADSDDTHIISASNSAYIELLPDTRTNHEEALIKGENFESKPGEMALLSYPIYFNTPGKYYFWARAFSTGTEDNGMHVGINSEWPESSRRLQLCQGKGKWTWSSAQRISSNHCGVAKTITLDIPNTGLHTIQISMREDGFELDQFIMTLDKSFQPKDKAYPVTLDKKATLSKKKILSDIREYRHILKALEHFETDSNSAVPYYQHQAKAALAINAAKKDYRDKFATAIATFETKHKKPRKYDVTLVTLAETDGESKYQVKLNDKIIGEFTNPETVNDYAETYFKIKGISIKSGDKISVSSMAVTNGKIPENDETAYARGRWRAIVLQ